MAAEGLDLSGLREEYARAGLSEGEAHPDPLVMFTRWFEEVREAGLHEPNAVVVATASADGAPSARTVLLKGVDAEGFRFYTNLASRKGHELAANPACALLFPWHPLERQVRVEGTAEPLPRAEVEAYFASRPRGSRLGAWASHQSTVVDGADQLARDYAEVEARFDGDDALAPPEEWGGYLVRPHAYELWQGRPSRMHDRLRYTRDDAAPSGWRLERLAP